MERKRAMWLMLTMLWAASLTKVSAGKAEVCSLPMAEKGECRGTKIKFTWHAQQDRSKDFSFCVDG